MARFAANLTMLFQELPLDARFDAAAKAGFDAVELLWPLEEALSPQMLAGLARDAGVEFALIDTPRGSTFGNGALSGAQNTFERELKQTLEAAAILNATHVHIMSGLSTDPKAPEVLTANIRMACNLAPQQSFVIEPISEAAVPGYFLNSFERASAVIFAAKTANCGLLLDTFHAQNMGLDPTALWENNKDRVRHIQVSSHPDRAEPRDSEAFSFAGFFQRLDEQKYTGVISGEYHPAGDTAAGADWF